MSKSKQRLGKGLSAIFGDNFQEVLKDIENGNSTSNSTNEIKIEEIRSNPYQPRKTFNEESLKELAISIKEHGVFQPIIVRKSVVGYELISGERRTRASKIAGKDTIPAIIVDFDDKAMMEISLLENIQREDLSIIEEAKAYQSLIKNLNYTQEDLSNRIGKSRTHITNTLRLLKLPYEIIDMLEKNIIPATAARTLLSLNDKDEMIKVAEKVITNNLSVREIEKLVNNLNNPKSPKKVKELDLNLKYVKEIFENKIQSKVEINENKISFYFNNSDDLNRILEILNIIEK